MTREDWDNLRGKLVHMRIVSIFEVGGTSIEIEAEVFDAGDYGDRFKFEVEVERE